MHVIITSIIFGIMIYIYMELHQERERKYRLNQIIKMQKKQNDVDPKRAQENQELSDMQRVFTDQEEIKYLSDEQEIANIISSGEQNPLNTIVNQALIQQRRGRPEQTIHIVDQSLRQSPGRITSIQTNLVNLPLSFQASQVDASNPFRDSVRPVRNVG